MLHFLGITLGELEFLEIPRDTLMYCSVHQHRISTSIMDINIIMEVPVPSAGISVVLLLHWLNYVLLARIAQECSLL